MLLRRMDGKLLTVDRTGPDAACTAVATKAALGIDADFKDVDGRGHAERFISI